MDTFPFFLLIALAIAAWAFIDIQNRRPIPNSPFVERDANGFLTLESYKSHIQYYTDGSMEVDLWALSQTEEFRKAIEGTRKIREFVQSKKKS